MPLAWSNGNLIETAGARAFCVSAELSDGRQPTPARVEAEGHDWSLFRALAEAEVRLELCERQLIELNHRFATTLQIVSGRLEAQRSRLTEPAARECLDKVFAGVQATASLHRFLCGRDTARWVDFGGLLEEMSPAIGGASGLICEVEADSVEVPGQMALQLASAVNELALNARKHAYGGRDGGSVRIVCRRDPGGKLSLSVVDRGPGLPIGFDVRSSTGLGLAIVRATAAQFGGELRVECDRGACFTMLLRVPDA